MKNRLLKGLALAVSMSFAAGVTIVPAQAASEILIWADETRGPNLTKVFAKKGDWVPGSTIKVVSFSSYDALKDALDKASGTTGPDIFVAGNDWVPALAKSGKLAPVVLTAAQKAQFTPSQFFDLSYGGKLYCVPVDVNNVGMVYNTKLVKSAPKTYGDMVKFYLANKSKLGLKAGLCVAGGGMSWGALSGFSALGAEPYIMNADGTVNYNKSFDPAVFAKNVSTLLLDKKGKSNGFWPATDTGCQDNYLAGKVPFAIIGNWHWRTFAEAGFDMNIQPAPDARAARRPASGTAGAASRRGTQYLRRSGRGVLDQARSISRKAFTGFSAPQTSPRNAIPSKPSSRAYGAVCAVTPPRA